MKKISLKTKILTGVLAGGVLLSSASMAFADTLNSYKSTTQNTGSKIEFRSPIDNQNFSKKNHGEMKNALESVLDEALTSKTITQDEKTKILEYAENRAKDANDRRQKITEDIKNMNKEELKEYKDSFRKDTPGRYLKSKVREKGNLFYELVQENILTQEKSDLLKEKMHEKRQSIKDLKLKENLSELVSKGTITKDQSDKIISSIKESQNASKINFEKMKNMTQEERREYMKNIKDNHVRPIKALMDDGVITEDQAKALKKISPKRPNRNRKLKLKRKITK